MMKFLFICNGTRGDVEPCIAVGVFLQQKGHMVICLFPESFESLTIEAGLEFRNLGPGIFEKMKREFQESQGQNVYNRSSKTLDALLEKSQIQIQYRTIQDVQPDRIIHNFNSIIPLLWEIKYPGSTFLMSVFPYLHSTRQHAYFSFNGHYGSLINRITYIFAYWGKIQTLEYASKILDMEPLDKKLARKAINNQKAIYTISPTLFEKPVDWGDQIHIMGFHERDKTMNWEPDDALQVFLEKNPKVLFLTFGSMLSEKVNERTHLLLKILEKHSIPTIINTYAGGITKPDQYHDSLFYFTSSIPYEWIFPKVYAILHHGGSGTSHMAVKYGKPSLILPHLGDQYIWKNIIAEKGIGPKGVHVSKIKEAKLENLIADLWTNPLYSKNALRFSKLLRAEENLKDDLYRILIT